MSLNIKTATGLLEIGGSVKTQCGDPVIRSGRQASMRFGGPLAHQKLKTPIGLISYRGYFYLPPFSSKISKAIFHFGFSVFSSHTGRSSLIYL